MAESLQMVIDLRICEEVVHGVVIWQQIIKLERHFDVHSSRDRRQLTNFFAVSFLYTSVVGMGLYSSSKLVSDWSTY